MRVLVTGAAGFIGNETARVLLERGDEVVGIDNLNDYYDPALKQARLARLDGHNRFSFETLDLADRDGMARLFAEGRFERVVHLGAQAGVRFSIENPQAYLDSNLTGFGHVLEGCRRNSVEHLVYASSSSVYGANTRTPFRVEDNVDHPVSLYAATKKANEGMAHSYSHLYGLPTTGLRFFTVYGPWGRPDMAPMTFTKKILAGEPIEVFNEGRHERDFTYVDDIVEAVVRVLDQIAAPDPAWSSDEPSPATSSAPWRLYNIGNSDPVPLMEFIATIEQAVGKKAVMEMKPRQPGDVLRTAADVSALEAAVGFRPHTPLAEGIGRMVRWYRDFYRV
ncbi:capsular biosynthesis protein CpsI [Bosea sp. Tri-44]|uniref:NAD-dependent epimerase n=1 Tax=Bosea sp. Tri-44 TaxID=1972137 RepID=UPI00100E30CB|nr:NAD-dependent epimerase [Bosea sp. Tri-44]RXT48192.1 capsular biosynthesis protein CpsI [Bosea sp. Tri-44]